MELLQFEVTNAGTLGSRWTPPPLKQKDILPARSRTGRLSCRRRMTRMIGAAMFPT